ncbi:zincin-like metallopeptidase domain-containing protein [Shewanella sp. MF05960]|uniref:zincin-like metallopeptidase domain-containing protein n=1 Tax=Shewanella sp. MF05960 TaxID=3434874 RepID=UPI003D7AAFD0
MKQTRPSASDTTEKKSQQDQILDRLFDYFSKPKGEKPSSDSDIEISFYHSKLNALPKNFHNNNYNGVNIIMLLQAQNDSATKVPIYATFKQIALLELDKNALPPKSENFDPDKILKGIKLDSQVVKYLETFKKDGEQISKSQFNRETKGMSFKELRDNNYQRKSTLKYYSVFPIERIKHLLPKWFIDERPYFSQQEELEKKVMSIEMQDQHFVEKALFIIDCMGVPVIEKNEDRAFYSPREHQIIVPPRHKFVSDKAYFAVILHELSHSTSRQLARDVNNPFGSMEYAKEELIAETATMFMCLEEGLQTFNSHARYLEGWASHFSDKKKVLLSVCKQAKEAQQYISDKVVEHKLKLANQDSYTVSNQLDLHVDFRPKYRQELRGFLDTQANTYGTMIPLRNQTVVGFKRIPKGIEVFTDEKSVKIYGTTAQNLEQKLSELEIKQKLFNCSQPDTSTGKPRLEKPSSSTRLSM